jgi:DNA-binding NarL/FixJ family response regulator
LSEVVALPTERELEVVIGDDQVASRMGIRRAIEPHGMRVVAEADTAPDAVRVCLEQQPDVCVLSTGLPGDGLEAMRLIKQALPAIKVVVLTVSERDDDLFAALRAGAEGYLLMSTSVSRLPHAIRGVVNGEAALPRELTARLIREFRERGQGRRPPSPFAVSGIALTGRELDVLERLQKREPTAEMADDLGISQVTVRRHVSSLVQKLGVPNRGSVIEMLDEAERKRKSAGEHSHEANSQLRAAPQA